jgi:hypothetical protein
MGEEFIMIRSIVSAIALVATAATAQTINPTGAAFPLDTTVAFSFTGAPGGPNDWVGLAAVNDPINTYQQWNYTGDVVSGDGTVAGVTTPGTYVLRLYTQNTYILIAESAPFVIGGANVATNAASYTQPADIVVSYTEVDPALSDWVGIVPEGQPSSAYVAWQYVSLSGSSTFASASLAPGNYVARTFAQNGFGAIATSAVFTVVAPAVGAATVTSTAPSFVVGNPVTIAFTNLSAATNDWIGIFPVGTSNTGYVAWAPAATSPLSFSSIPVGSYTARGFRNNSSTVVAAESAVFTVSDSNVAASVQADANGLSTIDVSFAGLDPASLDWIGVYQAGGDPLAYLQWTYVATSSGTISFTGLPEGTFEVRAYANNTIVELLAQDTVTLPASPVP